MGSKNLVQSSILQGNNGTALRQSTTIQQFGTEVIIGQSPTPGTGCSFYLKTYGDAAYQNAQVNFYVMQDNHAVLFESQTISPTMVSASTDLVITAGNCAADAWQVSITLLNGSTPALATLTSIIATGYENFGSMSAGGGGETLFYTTTATGPSASGAAAFTFPGGVTMYQVTCIAKVVTAGGGSEAVGDSFDVTLPLAFSTISGITNPVTPSLSAPNQFYTSGSAMSGMVFGPASSNTIPWTTPAGVDAGTVIKITIELEPLGSA